MNTNQQQLLLDLCEDPGSFIELVENWAEHKYPDSFLIKRLFTKHHLFHRIINPRIQKEPFLVDGRFINPVQVVFQIQDDPYIYRLFGSQDEHEMVHVVLARISFGDLPN